MQKIYQSTLRILAAQILAIELGREPDKDGQPGAEVALVKVEGGEAFAVPVDFAEKQRVQVGGYLGLTPDNQAVFIPAATFATSFAYVGDVPSNSIEYTFDAFVEYGINAGGNVVRGFPWSFTFHGRAVTHLSDDEYLIANGTVEGLRFKRGQILRVEGEAITVITPEAPAPAPAKPARSARRKK